KTAGTVLFAIVLRYITNDKDERIAIYHSAEILIYDDKGRESVRHKIPNGATISVGDGDNIEAGQRIASWDPLTRPIVSEYAGTVRFENIEENVTVARQVDEVTGLSTLVVITPKTHSGRAAQRPQIKLLDE